MKVTHDKAVLGLAALSAAAVPVGLATAHSAAVAVVGLVGAWHVAKVGLRFAGGVVRKIAG